MVVGLDSALLRWVLNLWCLGFDLFLSVAVVLCFVRLMFGCFCIVGWWVFSFGFGLTGFLGLQDLCFVTI